MINWNTLSNHIRLATLSSFSHTHAVPVTGGDSNQTHLLSGSNGLGKQHVLKYFIKLNRADKTKMFAAETAALAELAKTQTIKLPLAITHGIADEHCFLVLEYLDLRSQGNYTLLGTQLAELHRNYASQFGWSLNNTIGVTPQHNARSSDWISFWGEQRLGFQLELASFNGCGKKLQALGKSIVDALPDIFSGYTPKPSLLHGDLWGGNHAFLADGTPVIFDPASYYGDRETDIAMTELFGGFAPEFYAAYEYSYPLDSGYSNRKVIYNLYHILNHLNMVSRSYESQAIYLIQTIQRNLIHS